MYMYSVHVHAVHLNKKIAVEHHQTLNHLCWDFDIVITQLCIRQHVFQ